MSCVSRARKILVTGATGFIGANLVRRLVAKGHEVAALARPDSDLSRLGAARPRVTVAVFDGTLPSMIDALEQARPDMVVHVASLFLAQHRPEDVGRLIASNIDMPAKLLEAMAAVGATRLINTGTSWQHHLDAPYNPVNLYAATKQAFEDILAYYQEARGLRALSLKLFDTYGPGDVRPKLFSLLRRAARTGEPLKMSPGEQLIDLVHIDDVLDGYVLAIDAFDALAPGSYALGNPERLSLRRLVAVYSEIIGRPLRIEWGGAPYRPRETMIPWTQGRALPGWSPRVALRDGIRAMEMAWDALPECGD
jgi:nucleoside-diphosphate-sugar epimerase